MLWVACAVLVCMILIGAALAAICSLTALLVITALSFAALLLLETRGHTLGPLSGINQTPLMPLLIVGLAGMNLSMWVNYFIR